MRIGIAVTLLTLMLGSLPVLGQSRSSGSFAGTVQFSDNGSPAVHARILLFDQTDLQVCAQGFTDESGRFSLEVAGLSVSGGALPYSFTLAPNYPNPFNPGTVIPYVLSETAQVRLEVYNLLGHRVRVLVNERQSAGSYGVMWDAWDGSGQGVGAGVYLYRLTVGAQTATRSMVLLDGAPSAVGVSSSGSSGSPAPVSDGPAQSVQMYGLTISGAGVETDVDPALVLGGLEVGRPFTASGGVGGAWEAGAGGDGSFGGCDER